MSLHVGGASSASFGLIVVCDRSVYLHDTPAGLEGN